MEQLVDNFHNEMMKDNPQGNIFEEQNEEERALDSKSTEILNLVNFIQVKLENDLKEVLELLIIHVIACTYFDF